MLVAERNLSDREYQRVIEIVYRNSGINLSGKEELIRARLAKQMRGTDFESASEYLDHVEADTTGAQLTALIDSLSTNLTSFFRESRHFDYLRDKFLPDLLQRKAARGQYTLRAWSAACSSGEEAYSLAMTLAEAVAGDRIWDVKLLATDICTRVLDVARRGTYDAARLEPVPPVWRSRYFTSSRTGGGGGRTSLSAGPALQSLLRFRHLNLLEPWPFGGPFDFIFCRNVMIYFDRPTQQKLVNRFWDVLDTGGLLFTGHSESLTGVTHRFRYVEPTIYAKA